MHINNTFKTEGSLYTRTHETWLRAMATKKRCNPWFPLHDRPWSEAIFFLENRKWHVVLEDDRQNSIKMFNMRLLIMLSIDTIYNKPAQVCQHEINDWGRLFVNATLVAWNHQHFIVGYQARREEKLLEGSKQLRFMLYYPVRSMICKERTICTCRSKGCLNWLSELENKPKKISSLYRKPTCRWMHKKESIIIWLFWNFDGAGEFEIVKTEPLSK
jgi:hypothetical protein